MKLTAKTTASTIKLPHGKTDVIYFDDALTGFGLRIRVSVCRFRRSCTLHDRRARTARRLLRGSAEVLGADQARAAAKAALAKVALGEDPQALKIARRERDANTLKAVVADYLAAKAETVRTNTFRELDRYLVG